MADEDDLDVARAEARRTLDAQRDALDDVDAKAAALLRFDVGLATVLVSGLSVATAAGTVLGPLAVGFAASGVAALLLSALAAAVAYAASPRYVGVGPADLDRLAAVAADGDGGSGDGDGGGTDAGHESSDFEARLLSGYAAWIRVNRRTNRRKALYISAAVLAAATGAVLLALGGLAVHADPFALSLATLLAALLVGTAGYAAGVHRLLSSTGEGRAGTVAPAAAGDAPAAGEATYTGGPRAEDEP